jgi:serine/threonine-protein kinase RsbW
LVFKIPSNFEAGHEVQRKIMEDLEKAGFSAHSFFALKLALEEALVNAIKHGNRLDPRKTVSITSSVSPDRAEITVEDQGAGFDRSHVPDPTCDANLEKCSGRGILLIESYMSRVRWDRGGRRLKMVKENEADRE